MTAADADLAAEGACHDGGDDDQAHGENRHNGCLFELTAVREVEGQK